MATYIAIHRIYESAEVARYRFSDEGRSGVLEIKKDTGEVTLSEPMNGDERKRHFMRAAVKVAQAWKSGAALPEFTEWAS